MPIVLKTILTLALSYCIIIIGSHAKDELEGFYVYCGSGNLYIWTLINCHVPNKILDGGYVLHLIPVTGPMIFAKIRKTITEKLNETRVAWCTFPSREDGETFTYTKGPGFQILVTMADLYMFALTDMNSSTIIAKDFIEVGSYECSDVSLDPSPDTLSLVVEQIFDTVEVKVQYGQCEVLNKRNVTWTLARSFYLLEDEKNCFDKALMGKLDMSAFMSMENFRPAEIQLVGDFLRIPASALPYGYTFFSATLFVNETIITLSTFVKFENIAHENDGYAELHVFLEPFPPELIWYEDRDLVLDASQTFARQLTPESGFVGHPRTFLKFEWECIKVIDDLKSDGTEKYCFHLPFTEDKILMYGKNFRNGTDIIVNLRITLLGPDLNNILTWLFSKIITVESSFWPPIEIRCVHNCEDNRIYRSSPQVYRLHCPECFKHFSSEKEKYRISWAGCAVCGVPQAVYMVVPYDHQPGVNLTYTVTNVKTGGKIQFRHRIKPFPQREYFKHLMMSRPDTVIDTEQAGMHWIDVNKVSYSYRRIYTYDYVAHFNNYNNTVVWSRTFHDKVLNMPYLLKDKTGISYKPQIDLEIYSVDGIKMETKKMPKLAQMERSQRNRVSVEIIEDYWRTVVETMSYAQGLGFLYLFVHVLHHVAIDGEFPEETYNNVINVLLEREMSYSDARAAVEIMKISEKSPKIVVTRSFMYKHLQVWGKIMDVINKGPYDFPFNNVDCSALKSVSEMYNRMLKQSSQEVLAYRREEMFLNMLSKISKRHFNTVFEKKECHGTNFFMIWVLTSFYTIQAEYVYQFPDNPIHPARSLRMNKDALREIIELNDFVDYEMNIGIYSIGQPIYEAQDLKNAEFWDTLLVEIYRRSDNELLRPFAMKNATATLTFKFPVWQTKSEKKSFTMKSVMDGSYVEESDCVLIKIPTSRIMRLLMIWIPPGFEMAVMYVQADNYGKLIEYMASHNLSSKGIKDMIAIPLNDVSQSYKFQYASSHYAIALKVINGTTHLNSTVGPVFLNIKYALVGIHCAYWDNFKHRWDYHICQVDPSVGQFHGPIDVKCHCVEAGGLYSAFTTQHTKDVVDFSLYQDMKTLRDLQQEPKLHILGCVIFLWLFYIALLVWAKHKDRIYQHDYKTSIVPHSFNPLEPYRYLICVRTSPVPGAGMESKAELVIVGTNTTSGNIALDLPNNFLRGSESWFVISMAQHLGWMSGCVITTDVEDAYREWRVTSVDVFDIEDNALYILPCQGKLTEDKDSLVCTNAHIVEGDIVPGTYILDWFKKCFRSGHLLLNLCCPIPGAQKLIWDVTRLHCLVLTSLFLSFMFVAEWPVYNTIDAKKEEIGVYVLSLNSFLLILVSCMLYLMLVTCYPDKSWIARWENRMMPSPEMNISGEPPLPKEPASVKKPRPKKRQTTDRKIPGTNLVGPKILFNVWIAVVVGFMLILSWILVKLGFNVSFDDTMRTMWYMLVMLFINFLILQPLVILGVAIYNAMKIQLNYSHDWAHKRNQEAEHAMNYAEELQDINYIKRVRVTSEYEYYSRSSRSHMMLTMRNLGEKRINSKNLCTMSSEDQDSTGKNNTDDEEEDEDDTVYGDDDDDDDDDRTEDADGDDSLPPKSKKKKKGVGKKASRQSGDCSWVSVLNKEQQTKRKQTKIFKKLKKKGTLGLFVFIVSAFVIMRAHTKMHSTYLTKKYIYETMGLPGLGEVMILKTMTFDGVFESLNIYVQNYLSVYKRDIDTIGKKLTSFRMRQIRVKPYHDDCPVRSSFEDLLFPVKRCCHELDSDNEETRDFAYDWNTIAGKEMKNTPESNIKITAYHYQHSNSYSNILFPANQYHSDGYSIASNKIGKRTVDKIHILKKNGWLDENTRALFVEFSIFNVDIGVASVVTITYNFRPHGIFMSSSCNSFGITFKTIETVILVFALLVFTIHTLASLYIAVEMMSLLTFWKYLSKPAYLIDLFTVIFSLMLLFLLAFKVYLTQVKLNEFALPLFGVDKEMFIDLNDLAQVVITVNSLSGLLAFFGLLKFLRVARHIPRINVMFTLFRDMFLLFMNPALCILVAAILFCITLHKTIFYFHTLYRSLLSTLQFTISPLKVNEEIRASGVMAHLLLLAQWLLFLIIIRNVFIASVSEDYSVRNSETVGSSTIKQEANQSYLGSMKELGLYIIDLPLEKEDKFAGVEATNAQIAKEDDDFMASKLANL